jgi:hypothetical protein
MRRDPLRHIQPSKSFDLYSPSDLFEKLEWDMKQLSMLTAARKKAAVYQAINCFWTSWHLVDWLYECREAQLAHQFSSVGDYRRDVQQRSRAMTICRQIADGSKHRLLDFGRDDSIAATSLSIRFEDGLKHLALILEGDEPRVALDVLEEARRFWIAEFGLRGIPIPADTLNQRAHQDE